jgi:hypothetical protein
MIFALTKRLSRRVSILNLFVLLISGAPGLVHAGWSISATVTLPSASPAATSSPSLITVVSGNRIKYATRAWAQVVDLAAQRILIINHIAQVYWEGSLDEYLPVVAEQTRNMRAALLKQLSPEQRVQIEKRSGPFDSLAPTLTISFERTTEEDTIAGYKAHKYIVLRNGEAYEETWIAQEINFATEVDQQKFQALVKRQQEARTTPPGVVLAELTELLEKGYPVKTVNLLSGVTKTVVQSEQKTIPESEFLAPSHYTAKSLQEVTAPQPMLRKPEASPSPSFPRRRESKSKPMTFVQVLHCPVLVACAMRANGGGRGSRAQRALPGKCINIVWSDLVSRAQALPGHGDEAEPRSHCHPRQSLGWSRFATQPRTAQPLPYHHPHT